MKTRGFSGLLGLVLMGTVALAPVYAATAKGVVKTAAKPADKTVKDAAKPVSPTEVAAPAAPAVAAEKSARVTLLDKQTNRRLVLVLTAGEPQTVGSVVVKLTKCMPDYAGVLGQDIAWLEVTEGAQGSGRSTPWFAGWMFNTYPEISTLDHPRYDMQLQGCGVKARQVLKATGSAPVLDSAPVGDTETPNDTPVTQEDSNSGPASPAPADNSAGSDPYYVPGVDKSAPAAKETPADTETPAANPAAVEPQAGPADGQQDLHKMMDNGTY